jgi:hypothetical protein
MPILNPPRGLVSLHPGVAAKPLPGATRLEVWIGYRKAAVVAHHGVYRAHRATRCALALRTVGLPEAGMLFWVSDLRGRKLVAAVHAGADLARHCLGLVAQGVTMCLSNLLVGVEPLSFV